VSTVTVGEQKWRRRVDADRRIWNSASIPRAVFQRELVWDVEGGGQKLSGLVIWISLKTAGITVPRIVNWQPVFVSD
jgi:hypothetical protein